MFGAASAKYFLRLKESKVGCQIRRDGCEMRITNTDGVVCSAGDGEQGREMRTLIQVSVCLFFVLVVVFVC